MRWTVSKYSTSGNTNRPWLFISFGLVFLLLGISLFFGDTPSDVRGIPDPIYGFVCGAFGIICLVLGIYYLIERRSS
jgi:hypothetical protein